MLLTSDEVNGRDVSAPKVRPEDGERKADAVAPKLRIQVKSTDFEAHRESGLPDIFPCR